jgi:hypothetical protein
MSPSIVAVSHWNNLETVMSRHRYCARLRNFHGSYADNETKTLLEQANFQKVWEQM